MAYLVSTVVASQSQWTWGQKHGSSAVVRTRNAAFIMRTSDRKDVLHTHKNLLFRAGLCQTISPPAPTHFFRPENRAIACVMFISPP